MKDNREYDKKLVTKINNKEYTETRDGLEVHVKPVPDDERPHAMDPRLYQIAAKKKEMFTSRSKAANGGFRLSNERYRPDKITYDLNTVPIDTDERLISVDDDHMIDIFIYRRHDDKDKTLPLMIYLHGGGFTAGDYHLYEKQMKLVAELGHVCVMFPEYRLAPETPFPGAIHDCHAAIEYMYDHAKELNINPDKIMIAGDSAGGNLTNCCVLLDNKKIIKKIFELYPGWDSRKLNDIKEYTWSYSKYKMLEEQKDIVLSRIDRIKKSADQDSNAPDLYRQNKTTADDKFISPYLAENDKLKQFPKTIICASEFDYLRIQDEAAARKLQELGVDVTYVEYAGCDHGFLDCLGKVVQAEEACQYMANEARTM